MYIISKYSEESQLRAGSWTQCRKTSLLLHRSWAREVKFYLSKVHIGRSLALKILEATDWCERSLLNFAQWSSDIQVKLQNAQLQTSKNTYYSCPPIVSVFWEMHSTDLLGMAHCARVIRRSLKVLRGTSMVSMQASSYLVPNLASALAFTVSRVCVGSKGCWNLLPHGALTARSKLPLPASAVESLGLQTLVTSSPSFARLRLYTSLCRLTSDCLLFSIDGRTLYLFKDCGGAAGARCSMCKTSSWLRWLACNMTGWDRERRFLSGLRNSGDPGSLWMLFASPGYSELSTAGLLRPLEDFGLVRCIEDPLLWRFPAVFRRKCFTKKSKESLYCSKGYEHSF